jgi:hypothetical protein
MRKSAWVMAGILFVALAAMLFAANAMISPLHRDAELSGLLTRYFTARGELRPDTKLTAMRHVGSEKRLAKEGKGLVVTLHPSDAVLRAPGRMAALARHVARMAHEESRPNKPGWIELQLRVDAEGGPRDAAPLRTLVVVDADGGFGAPTPALPATLDAAAAPRGTDVPARPPR